MMLEGDYHVTSDAAVLPLRWMPPEAVKRLRFNTKADVWAFGMVM